VEDKLIVKQFKDGSKNWWCDNKHYSLIDGELILAAGGMESETVRLHMLKYLRTKKLL